MGSSDSVSHFFSFIFLKKGCIYTKPAGIYTRTALAFIQLGSLDSMSEYLFHKSNALVALTDVSLSALTLVDVLYCVLFFFTSSILEWRMFLRNIFSLTVLLCHPFVADSVDNVDNKTRHGFSKDGQS